MPNAQPVVVEILGSATIGEFKQRACVALNVQEEDVRVWDYFHNKPYALLEDMTRTLYQVQVSARSSIIRSQRCCRNH